MDFTAYCRNKLDQLKQQGRYRTFHPFQRLAQDSPHALHPAYDDEVTLWCSNDYLNMAQEPSVMARATEVLHKTGVGAGGTRNISGSSPYHQQLENLLADWHNKPSALLFTSGYVANFTALGTLARQIPGLITFSDAMNHNSMIEGIRAHKQGEKRIFRHNDAAHLEQLIQQEDPDRPKLVAWESLYSMDGDFAPNADLLEVCKKYNALSYVDEVHAVGLYGPEGAGVCARDGVQDDIDIIEGTLGKAVGCLGGYIAADISIVDFIRSLGNGFIFTTALPPMIAAAAMCSINLLKSADDRREKQQQHAALLRLNLEKNSIPVLPSQSHIVPVFIGDAKKCKVVSDTLLQQDRLYVQPINYPTVAVGTERLRLTPSPKHDINEIERLCLALKRIWHDIDLPRNLPDTFNNNT